MDKRKKITAIDEFSTSYVKKKQKLYVDTLLKGPKMGRTRAQQRQQRIYTPINTMGATKGHTMNANTVSTLLVVAGKWFFDDEASECVFACMETVMHNARRQSIRHKGPHKVICMKNARAQAAQRVAKSSRAGLAFRRKNGYNA